VLLRRCAAAGGRAVQAPPRRGADVRAHPLLPRPLRVPLHPRGHGPAHQRPPARSGWPEAGGGQAAPPAGRVPGAGQPRCGGGAVAVDGAGADVPGVPGEAGGDGRGAAAGQLRPRVPHGLHGPLDRHGRGDVPAVPCPAPAASEARPTWQGADRITHSGHATRWDQLRCSLVISGAPYLQVNG
jgi:hypothetical protein